MTIAPHASAEEMSIARPLSSVLVLLLACAVAVPAFAAETQRTPKPAAANTTTSDATGKPPLITHNPDGTMTVQKEPAAGKSEHTKQKGLVIPPQVVVPAARLPEKEPSNRAR